MIIFGYVQGYVPLAGYNFGAGNVKRMINGLKFTIVTGTGICLLFLIPFTVLAPTYMGAFTTNREIIEIGTLFLHAQAWAVPIMAIQTSLMSNFQATGQAMRELVKMKDLICITNSSNFLYKFMDSFYTQKAYILLLLL